MRSSKASPEVPVELEQTNRASALPRGDSVASMATSAGDYEPAFDDGVAAFDDEDL